MSLFWALKYAKGFPMNSLEAFLRIFIFIGPIYYLMLYPDKVLHPHEHKKTWVYTCFFTYNWHIASKATILIYRKTRTETITNRTKQNIFLIANSFNDFYSLQLGGIPA